jgi:AcrR family transcriptional regulator
MSNKKANSLARVVETAAQMFAERPFEEVQVAQIAARARCSSATIYEAFETKKGLFRAAMLHNAGRRWPEIADGVQEVGLTCLLEFLTDRIHQLATPTMKSFWRNVSEDAANVPQAQGLTRKALQDASRMDKVVDEVRRCMESGLLRQDDPYAVTYLIMAGTGYEPVVYSLMFGAAGGADAPAIIHTVMSPLVTEVGRTELAAYVSRNRSNLPPEDPEPPSLIGFLRTVARE